MRPVLDSKGLDQFEFGRSRQFVHFVRNARNIRTIADIYHKIKKQKDWGADPKLVDKNPLFADWLHNMPPDLQIHYPPDGSPPWIPSHFMANVHSHCHLGIILLHRPQLLASKSFAAGGGWKVHMALCYSSAKALCRLQESIIRQYGLLGLLYMQRGVSFAIYCILTCTMLHLVSLCVYPHTSEDSPNSAGRNNLPRPSIQRRRARLLYPAYACPRKVFIRMAHARDAGADRRLEACIFC